MMFVRIPRIRAAAISVIVTEPKLMLSPPIPAMRITEAVKRLRLSSRSTAFSIFRPETAINPYRAIQTPPMTQEGIEAMSAMKGVMNEKITQPTAAARIVTTEAFLVIATQPTLSP